MEIITWKKPKTKLMHSPASEAPEFNLESLARYVDKCRSKLVGTHPSSVADKAVFIVNQDGLQNRDVNHLTKRWFKNEIMKQWHSILPDLPNPFTGTLEVHCHQGKLGEVKFILNN